MIERILIVLKISAVAATIGAVSYYLAHLRFILAPGERKAIVELIAGAAV